MCDCCNPNNTYKDGVGDWICYYNEKDNKWHLYTEIFLHEYSDFEIKFCPECGRKLEEKL